MIHTTLFARFWNVWFLIVALLSGLIPAPAQAFMITTIEVIEDPHTELMSVVLAVPEPSNLALVGAGLVLFGNWWKKLRAVRA